MLIPGVRKEDNPALINIMYHKANKTAKDYLSIIYKIGEEKYVHNIEEPKFEFYWANDKILRTIEDYYPMNKLDKHTVKYKDLLFNLAKLGDNEDFFYENIRAGKSGFKRLGALHLQPNIFGSDIDIEDFYIFKFVNEYGINDNVILKKGFFDIEVDGIKYDALDVESAHAPVNMITYINNKDRIFHVFMMVREGYHEQDKLLNNPKILMDKIHDYFDSKFGNLEYRLYSYNENEEDKMIRNFFSLLYRDDNDYVGAWNGFGYDYPYLTNRYERLGRDKRELCDLNNFNNSNVYINVYNDTRNSDIENKNSSFTVSSKTVFFDNMITYASNRKAGDSIESYKLDDVCLSEIGMQKVEHGEYSMKEFPYKNWLLFFLYSIKDTLILMELETKIEDIENVYFKSLENITRPGKVFRQTIFLSNRAYLEYYKDGLIKGCNPNSKYNGAEDLFLYRHEEDEADRTVNGAIVANPLLNERYGIKLNGIRSNRIFVNCIDMDYSSEYPSATISHNISNGTMIGMLKVINFSPYNESMYYDEKFKYLKGGNLLDDLSCNAFFKFGTKWLCLPTVRELIIGFKNYLKNKENKRELLKRKQYKNEFAPTKKRNMLQRIRNIRDVFKGE